MTSHLLPCSFHAPRPPNPEPPHPPHPKPLEPPPPPPLSAEPARAKRPGLIMAKFPLATVPHTAGPVQWTRKRPALLGKRAQTGVGASPGRVESGEFNIHGLMGGFNS